MPVSSIADLNSGITGANLSGTRRFVNNATQSWWMLNREKTLTPDSITVVAATGGGSWIREAPRWEREVSPSGASSALYVNTTSGNDEADGTVGAPLKSVTEWQRRIGNCRQRGSLTIRVTGDDTLSFLGGDWYVRDYADYVSFVAEWPTATYSSTIASWANVNTSTPEFYLLSLAGLADISAYCGYPYVARIVGGDRDGATAVLGAANPGGIGAQYARCTGFVSPAGAVVTPQVGDAIEICTRYKARGVRWTGVGPHHLPHLRVTGFDIAGSVYAPIVCPDVRLQACAVGDAYVRTPFVQLYSVHLYGDSEAQLRGLLAGNSEESGLEDLAVVGCLVTAPTMRVLGGMTTCWASLWQGASLALRGGGARWRHEGCGHFDVAGVAITVESSTAQLVFDTQNAGKSVGSGNTTGLYLARSGALVEISSGNVPVIGATNEVSILGTVHHWVDLPQMSGTTGVVIV